jgi:hypothetical protein
MEKVQFNVSVSKEVADFIRSVTIGRQEAGYMVERALRMYIQKMKHLEESYKEEK